MPFVFVALGHFGEAVQSFKADASEEELAKVCAFALLRQPSTLVGLRMMQATWYLTDGRNFEVYP